MAFEDDLEITSPPAPDAYTDGIQTTDPTCCSIPYYDGLMQEEQVRLTASIRLLLHQTFILERKFDRRSGRFQYNPEFRSCNKHLEFIRSYFAVSGIEVLENSQIGLIYIQGENLVGDKLPKLATLYLLVLKLIYDEQMESVSTSVNVYTTLREIHEKLGNYRLFRKQPSPTDIRRAVTLLKKYQILEPLDLLEDLNSDSRMIIYPCINVVLMGDDARQLLASFDEGGEEEGVQEKVALRQGTQEKAELRQETQEKNRTWKGGADDEADDDGSDDDGTDDDGADDDGTDNGGADDRTEDGGSENDGTDNE